MRRRMVVVLAVAVLAAACGPPGTQGVEIVTDGATPAGPQPSTSTSLVATPTVPVPPATGGIGDIKAVNRFHESVRLASRVLSPTTIAPEFRKSGFGAQLSIYKESLLDETGFSAEFAQLAPGYGFVAGVYSSRRTTGDSDVHPYLESTLLIFKDEPSAAAAAEAAIRLVRGNPKTADIPQIPGARVIVAKGANGTGGYVQRGNVVLRAAVGSLPDEARRMSLVTDLMTRQLAALDGFQPTPVAQLPSLQAPFDADGAIRKLLTDADTFNPQGIGGVFDAGGALLFQTDPQAMQALYRDNGVDRYVVGKDMYLTRAADDAGAVRVRDGYVADYATLDGYGPATSPAEVPSARCVRTNPGQKQPQTQCVFARGRYVVEVLSESLKIGQLLKQQWDRLG